MVAVIFEVMPKADGRSAYLAIAADLREHLVNIPGFISVERFQSLSDPDKMLSLSFWEDEESISRWRNLGAHRTAQSKGRDSLFLDYRIRIGNIIRDYSLSEREQAPKDSIEAHARI